MNNNSISPAEKAKGVVQMMLGLVYILLAGVIIWAQQNSYINLGQGVSIFMAVIFVLYGAFRVYRGYLKMKGRILGGGN